MTRTTTRGAAAPTLTAALAAAALAGCQGDAGPRPDPRIDALEERIRALDDRVDALERAAATDAGGRPTSRPARDEVGAPAPDPALAALADELGALLATTEGEAALAGYRELRARGLDPDHPDSGGAPPLVLATRAGHAGVAAALLEDGAEPDQRALERGATALFLAAEAGDAELCELLYRAGADATVVCGPTPGAAKPWASSATRAAAEGHDHLASVLDRAERGEPDRAIAVEIDRLVAVPLGGLADPPLEVVLGRDAGWGRVAVAVSDAPVGRADPGVVTGYHGEALFRVPLRWRRADATGRRDVVVNELNTDEQVVGAVLEVGPPDARVRLELELRPHMGI